VGGSQSLRGHPDCQARLVSTTGQLPGGSAVSTCARAVGPARAPRDRSERGPPSWCGAGPAVGAREKRCPQFLV